MYRFVIAMSLIIVTAVANYGYSKPEKKLPRPSFANFPKEIDEYRMVAEQEIDEDAMKVLLVDDYLMRTYQNSNNDTIGLYIGYFYNQREGKQIHSPRQCLPGSGWAIIDQNGDDLIDNVESEFNKDINFYLMGKGPEKQLYLWWYQGRGRIYANEYLNKIYRMWDAMSKRRTDGALVRINMGIKKDFKYTIKTQLEFIKKIEPTLDHFIPK